MRKIMLSVFVFCALALCVTCGEANADVPENALTAEDKLELSMTDYNRIFLWVATCISDDDNYGNYVSLRETHPDWYGTFYRGDADFGLLMEIGRFYFMQDIYGDTTGEGDWQNEENVMLMYFGMTDTDFD